MINFTLADMIRKRNRAEKELEFWKEKIEEGKALALKHDWDYVDRYHKGVDEND